MKMARSEGFEPPTPRFEVWCSIQLSYERGASFRSPAAYSAAANLEEPPDLATKSSSASLSKCLQVCR